MFVFLGILQVKPEFIQSSPKVKEREVEFLWTLNCEDVRGQIEGFDVILTGMSKWVKDYLNESFVKERSATFDSLHPFSDYRVSIGVQGNDGPSDDEYALVRDFKTNPDSEYCNFLFSLVHFHSKIILISIVM